MRCVLPETAAAGSTRTCTCTRTVRRGTSTNADDVRYQDVLSDETVVQQVLQQPDLFGLLYDRYAQQVYRYAQSQLRSATDADDVVSETMLAVFVNLHRFDSTRGTFRTWLFTIATRKVRDAQRIPLRLVRLLRRISAGTDAPQDSNAEDDAATSLLRREEQQQVQQILRRLSASDQQMLGLRYAADLSHSDIAAICGLSDAATRQRLSRATRRFAAAWLREQQELPNGRLTDA
jgi:RNA polymerase sigma factor (sigma-70 family)